MHSMKYGVQCSNIDCEMLLIEINGITVNIVFTMKNVQTLKTRINKSNDQL